MERHLEKRDPAVDRNDWFEQRLMAVIDESIDRWITKRTPWLVLWHVSFVVAMGALIFGLALAES